MTFSQPTTQLHYYQSSLVFAQHSGRLDIIFVKMLCLTIIAGYWQHLLPSLDQDTFQLFSPKWLLQNFLNADNDLSKNVKKKKGGNWPLAKRSWSLYLIPLFVSCPWSSWEFCWSNFHHPRHPYWSSLLWLLLFDKEGEGICQSWKSSLLLMLLLSESVLTWHTLIIVDWLHGIFADKLAILRVILPIWLFAQPETRKPTKTQQQPLRQKYPKRNNDKSRSHLMLVAEREKGGAFYFNLPTKNWLFQFRERPTQWWFWFWYDRAISWWWGWPVGQSGHRAGS